jgi:hypothetical protein
MFASEGLALPPMVEPKDVVLAIFGGTAALGALVLVFLGLIASAIQSLPVAASPEVKRPYRIAGGVAFAAFLLSITCAALSAWWLLLGQPHRVYLAVVWAFLAQLALLTVAAALVVIKMIFR